MFVVQGTDGRIYWGGDNVVCEGNLLPSGRHLIYLSSFKHITTSKRTQFQDASEGAGEDDISLIPREGR